MRSRISMRMLCVLAATLAVASIAGTNRLHAQRWQDLFGTVPCPEGAARGGQGVSTGGYIAAGFSNSPSPNCSGAIVYVVRTDDAGALMWSYTYDIGGGNSHATCIRECANGDFIVTGATQNTNACCCNKDAIFLMRLDPNGGVRWVRSYGAAGGNVPFSVIETTLGNGSSTKPGDFVVCGYSFNNGTVTKAYILRTSAGGHLIWDRTYSGLGNGAAIYYDIDEATINTPGSLLAVGQVTPATGAPMSTLVRVDGNNGNLLAGPILWGAGGPQGTNAWSVKELKISTPGDIAVTGQIQIAATTNAVAYIARFAGTITCPPAPPIVAKTYTPAANSIGQDIQEATSGNILVAGTATNYPGGFGSADAMLIEVDPTNLNYAGSNLNLYGGNGADFAASVAEQSPTAASPGFIIAGQTSSPAPPGDIAFYMIKTDATGSSLCNFTSPTETPVAVSMVPSCYTPTLGTINQWCSPPWTADAQTWQNQLCFAPLQNHREDNPSDGTARAPQPGNNAVIAITDDASVAGYPNPVRKGSTFNLEYGVAHAGQVRIEVADVSGRIVYSHSGDYPAGTNQIPVDTQGWTTGAYIIKLTTDGAAASRRVMVVDK